MKDIKNNLKKIGIGTGIILSSYLPLKSQENPLVVKAGLTYNIVQTKEMSKNCLGFETVLEKNLKERLSVEGEVGLYADTRTTSEIVYSRMQMNMGLKYKPFVKNGWSMGGKLALGVSNEIYKPIECSNPLKETFLNKLVGLDVEKKFKNGKGLNISLSREIDRNVWKIGLKGLLKRN